MDADVRRMMEQMFGEALYEAGENYQQSAVFDSEHNSDVILSDRSKNFEKDKYFERQIDRFDSLSLGSYITVGKIKKGSPINMVGIPDGNLYFDVSKIVQEMSTRRDPIPKEVIKRIPDVLNNPIVITEYKGKNGSFSINIYGHLFVGSSPVVVGVMIGKHRNGVSVNKVQTVHPNRNALLEVTPDNTLYVNENKKETDTWFQALGAHVPLSGRIKYGFNRMVSQPNAGVKNYSSEEVAKIRQDLEPIDLTIDQGTESVSPSVMFSERTWQESDYVTAVNQAADDIAKNKKRKFCI